jgi:hypothetical protein
MRDSTFSVRFSSILFVAAAACGGSTPSETSPDAGMTGSGSDTGSGSGSDTGSGSGSDVGSGSGSAAPTPLTCDYIEQQDTTNDFYEDDPGIEETGMTFSGTQKVICGVVNNGHFDGYYQHVDVDNYGFTVSQDANVFITLRATAADMNAISTVGFFAYNADTYQTIGGYFVGDHGAATAMLTAGDWQIDIEASDNQDAASTVDYQLVISPDDPASRCATLGENPSYVEAHDGIDSTGNDMLSDNSGDQHPTMLGSASTPESTGMSMSGGTRYLIQGVSADVASMYGDSYFDRDTYLVTTDATTNQLSFRINQTSGSAVLDYYVLSPNSSFQLTETAYGTQTMATLAVQPSSSYWVWVGAESDSQTPAVLPVDYGITLCAETFVTTPVP